MNITGGPGNRDGAYYSFDQDNGKFKYLDDGPDYDTRAYDYKSNTWTNLNSTNEPTKRRSYASNMFYDPIMKRSIFYGGTYSCVVMMKYGVLIMMRIHGMK